MPKCFFYLLFLSLFITSLEAQNLLARSEVGLSLGGMNYLGDLNDQSMFGKVSLAGGLAMRYNFDSRWAVVVSGVYGHIEGGNPDVDFRRNLSFRSPVLEGSLRAEFNFRPYGLVASSQKRSTPYIFCGIGLFKFNPRAMVTDPETGQVEWYDLQPLCTEGQGSAQYPERHKYQLLTVSMPFGVGYRWRLSPSTHLTVEYGWRKTWTDYLDDVSTTYVGSDLLLQNSTDGQMAATLADRSATPNAVGIKRGDDSLNDWYAYLHVGIGLRLETILGWTRSKRCKL